MLRVIAGLDKLIAEGWLDDLISALRELVRRIPELTPQAMRGGELKELITELQAFLNQFLDLLELLPPEAGEVAIEILQLALDIAGLFPGPDDVVDVISAIISARRGGWWDAILSAGSGILLAGIALGVAKIGKRLKKLAMLIAKLKGPAREILGHLIDGIAKAVKDIPLTSVQAAVDGLKRFVTRLRELLKEAIEKLRRAKKGDAGGPSSTPAKARREDAIEEVGKKGSAKPGGSKTGEPALHPRARSIKERLQELYSRLGKQPPSKNADDALERIRRTVNEVEDELSQIPKKTPPPKPNKSDGRMYPPEPDYTIWNPDGSISAHTRGHQIDIGKDGSIRITNTATGDIEFQQSGSGT